MKLHIKVTSKDIENGFPNEPCKCPIALALIRAFPHDRLIPSVTGYAIEFIDSLGRWYMYCPTTREIEDFIRTFDSGNFVKEFECDLDFEHV